VQAQDSFELAVAIFGLLRVPVGGNTTKIIEIPALRPFRMDSETIELLRVPVGGIQPKSLNFLRSGLLGWTRKPSDCFAFLWGGIQPKSLNFLRCAPAFHFNSTAKAHVIHGRCSGVEMKNPPIGGLFNLILVVEIIGFEPMTSCMPCKRSSQLSYTPILP
jgi:hypothetical protein